MFEHIQLPTDRSRNNLVTARIVREARLLEGVELVERKSARLYSLFCIDPICLGAHKNSTRSSLPEWGSMMVSRCANPSCGAKFKYLHEGRLYHFMLNDRKAGPSTNDLAATVPFWWLCFRCCLSMALIPDRRCGVTLVPLQEKPLAGNPEKRELPNEQAAHLGC
jgi:hypothetical protein